MSSRCFLLPVAVLVTIAAVPAPAAAQIYSWRDSNGHLVLSDRPKDPKARTFAVGPGSEVRVTRRATAVRTSRYDALITEQAEAQGLSPDLVRAVVAAESGFNPAARSVKGAMGLMQLMPATAAEYGVVDPYDPAENVRAGTAYLKSLLTRYDGRVELALAAYNAGPGAVEKYGAIPPYRETQNYVNRIQAAAGPPSPAPARIYRSVEIVDGRPVPRYSNVRTAGAEVVRTLIPND